MEGSWVPIVTINMYNVDRRIEIFVIKRSNKQVSVVYLHVLCFYDKTFFFIKLKIRTRIYSEHLDTKYTPCYIHVKLLYIQVYQYQIKHKLHCIKLK